VLSSGSWCVDPLLLSVVLTCLRMTSLCDTGSDISFAMSHVVLLPSLVAVFEKNVIFRLQSLSVF